jgi:hypothetical protein
MAAKNLRRLQSHNLAAKGAYLLSLNKYCLDHKVFKKLQELETQEEMNWPAIETLDRVITHGMLHDEKSCRFRGQDPWSPKLSKARMKVEILKLAMSMARTKRDYRQRIDKLLGEYGDLLEIPNLIPEVQTALRLSQKELRVVLQNAANEQKEYLQSKQSAAVISSDPAAALKWRNLQRAEEIKAMYRKLRFIRQDSVQQSGLSRIEVPTDPTEDPKKCKDWTTIDAPEEMNKSTVILRLSHTLPQKVNRPTETALRRLKGNCRTG